MVEGKGLGIGIGIGIVMGIGIGVIALPLVDNMSNQPNPIADIIQTDDAHFAQINVRYDSTTDRLSGSLILTNKDGDYTKANGNLQLYVKKDGSMVHSATFDVTRDDFASWKNNNGEKITGYSFSLKKYFSSGPHDVLVDFVSGPEKSWIDLHDTFWSIN